MPGSVEIVELAKPRRFVYVEHKGPYFQVGDAVNRLFSIPGVYDLVLQPLKLLAIWLDDPEIVPASKLRSQVGALVSEECRIPDSAHEGYIPSGKYAKMTVTGPYSELPDAWRFFYTVWLSHSGERVRANSPGFEIYVNSPIDVPRDELITELHIPLR